MSTSAAPLTLARTTTLALAAALLGGAALSGCSPTREVTRVDPNVVVDLDYKFNADDARQVYQAMVSDALYRNWIDKWYQQNAGKRPVVIIGPIKNDTTEYIDTQGFTEEWQRELLNADRIDFVAMPEQRNALRQERAQGQEWNTPDTRKQMRAETGADLMLLGRVSQDTQQSLSGRERVAYYKVNLELFNIENNRLVWSGSHEIKKLVRDR